MPCGSRVGLAACRGAAPFTVTAEFAPSLRGLRIRAYSFSTCTGVMGAAGAILVTPLRRPVDPSLRRGIGERYRGLSVETDLAALIDRHVLDLALVTLPNRDAPRHRASGPCRRPLARRQTCGA